MITVTVFNV